MVAEIITIGDELLIGQTIDTNSAWMGQELNKIGIDVQQITSISDSKEHIVRTLKEREKHAGIILITGGLGPTKDDITKDTLAEYFNTELVLNEDVLAGIKAFFDQKGLEMLDTNIRQAMLPESADVLLNTRGTAMGMWFQKDGIIYVSMPGVPHEMKGIMSDHVLPRIALLNKGLHVYHKTILTQGIGESFLAKIVGEWEDSLVLNNIDIAYLPSLTEVKIRLTKRGTDIEEIKNSVARKVQEFMGLAGEYVFGYDEDTLEDILGKLLISAQKTLAVAESCTGGNIAKTITSVAGSSRYFLGGAVTYTAESKTKFLGVPVEVIDQNGVVSEKVALLMAEGVRNYFGSDYGISTTGIAGPEDDEKVPAGTVCIGFSSKSKSFAITLKYGKSRSGNIIRFTVSAINLLRKEILAENFD